jgi:uroporphyrinogen decarboxylase
MDRKQRVALTIRKEQADRVPRGELCIDDAVVSACLGVRDVAHPHRVEFASRLGLDLVCLPADYGRRGEKSRLPATDAVRWNGLDRWCTETDFFVFVLMDGGFSWGMRLLGFEDFMLAVARDAAKIQSLVRNVEAFNSALIREAASRGAHGIVIADDIAHGSGLMIPPESLRRFFFPSLARQAELARREGLSVFFHSDGNLDSVLDDLAHSGVDGLQCIEKGAGMMDLDAVRKKYGDRLCLWGNLDPALLTAPLNREELEREVSAIAATASRGGVIFGTSSGLFKGMLPGSIQYAYGLLSQEPPRISPVQI